MGRKLILETSESTNELKSTIKYFVKHDLKEVLKCIGVKTWTHHPRSSHRRDRHFLLLIN